MVFVYLSDETRRFLIHSSLKLFCVKIVDNTVMMCYNYTVFDKNTKIIHKGE